MNPVEVANGPSRPGWESKLTGQRATGTVILGAGGHAGVLDSEAGQRTCHAGAERSDGLLRHLHGFTLLTDISC